MTTDWTARRAGFAVFIVAASAVAAVVPFGCATTVSNRTGDTLDVSEYPPDIRHAYKVFAVRCSRCHTLARPLNARIDDPQQWVRYVARMRLNPSSGISAKNGEIILRFLLYYMHQRERERGGHSGVMEEPLGAIPVTPRTAASPAGATEPTELTEPDAVTASPPAPSDTQLAEPQSPAPEAY